jgi:HD-like signal output (HDOD) protein
MGKKVSFPCPNCKERINLDLRSKSIGQTPRPFTGDTGEDKKKAPVPLKSQTKDLPSGDVLKDKILKSLKDLPPMPQVVFKAREIMADPNSDLKKLSSVIKTDMSITSKILKMANSAYYGLRGKVSSVDHATVLLGQKTLGEVVTMASISGLLDSALNGYNLEPGDLWLHSLAVSFGSKILAEMKKPELANDAFIAGLLHDAGKIILDKPLLERKDAVDAFMEDEQQTFLDAEIEILGFDHAEIAFDMCTIWNIPKTITVAIKHHHYPSRSQGDELSYILHTADYIATLSGIGIGADDILYEAEEGAMELLGITQKTISDIVLEVIEHNNKMV